MEEGEQLSNHKPIHDSGNEPVAQFFDKSNGCNQVRLIRPGAHASFAANTSTSLPTMRR